MSLTGQESFEHIRVKTFLYKYTPKFTLDPSSLTSAKVNPARLTKLRKGATRSEALVKAFTDRQTGVLAEVLKLQEFLQRATSSRALFAAIGAIPGGDLTTPVTSVQVVGAAPQQRLLKDLTEAERRELKDLAQFYVNLPFGTLLRNVSTIVVNPPGPVEAVLLSFLEEVGVSSYTRRSFEEHRGVISTRILQELQLGEGVQEFDRLFTISTPPRAPLVSGTRGDRVDRLLRRQILETNQGFLFEAVRPMYLAWYTHMKQLLSNANIITANLKVLRKQAENANREFKAFVEKPFKVIKFDFELDAQNFFSKFDISEFVDSYDFNQKITSGTYNWSLSCRDNIVPFSQLKVGEKPTVRVPTRFRSQVSINGTTGVQPTFLPGPGVRASAQDTSAANDLVRLMAEYESEEVYSFTEDVLAIEQAMIQRGRASVGLESSTQLTQLQSQLQAIDQQLANATQLTQAEIQLLQSNKQTISDAIGQLASELGGRDGLRLSDLCQKYNFVSTFVYKSSVPLDEAIRRRFPTRQVPAGEGQFEPFNETNEVHLMLVGFKNEFNGFITEKGFVRRAGEVDQVSLQGQGILRLFSDTRRFYSTSVVAGGVYDSSEVVTLSSATEGGSAIPQVFQNKFANKNPFEIVQELLQEVYRISLTPSAVSVEFQDTRSATNQTSTIEEFRGFYDIRLIESNHNNQQFRNLFTIPVYLLATVMRLRNFHHQLPLLQSFAAELVPDFDEPLSTRFTEEYGGPCVQITANANQYRAYFEFIRQGWANYISELKTPFQIIDEIKKFTFTEFFERPNGRILFRGPQYNEIFQSGEHEAGKINANLVTSDDVALIAANYADNATELVSRIRTSYETPLAGEITSNLFQPAYTNGKLVGQYGFRESYAEANPNVTNVQFRQLREQLAGTAGANTLQLIHQYVRFFLEYNNARLKVGSLELEGSPDIEVGRLFLDRVNSKIGYIVGVRKQLAFGQTYTTTVDLEFVRDAASETSFRQLPTLEEMVSAVESTSIGNQVVNPGAFATSPTVFASVPRLRATQQDIQSAVQTLTQAITSISSTTSSAAGTS